MADPNPYPKVDYGQNTNSPDVLIVGAGIAGLSFYPHKILDC